MQESLITAVENNDIEQLKELLETITDIEKANAVIYSAYLGKMEALELLIEAGAVLDRPDTDGHTALYWAKERDHQAMIHLLHQHGASEEHISSTTMELLKTVGLKQADLTALGIKLEDLERSLNPRFLGQCLHFLVSVSLIKTFMLWPFMQRGGINLDQEGEAEAQSIRPRKNKRERPSFSDVSESEDARLLSANEFNDTEEESEPDDDIVIKDEADTDDKNERRDQAVILEEEVESHLAEERKHKRKTCSAPVFTSSALLFESEPILKTVAAINAFHETVDTLISSVWNAFLSSLIINGLINYALYPEERGESDLLDAFGITGLRNFGCVTSIKAIKDSFLCSSSYKKGYEDVLSDSLSSYYIWPFIAGLPVLFGVINAIRASWNMKALDKRDVKALIQQLKEYKPGFWADGLGWIFTAAIPDLFPPAAILFMLPQPAIKNALEKIRQTIIWDGRLSAKDRQKLFNHLNRFAQQRSQFTQMKALSMLADIVDGINFKNLAILKEEGVDDETIKTLTIIKTKALKELEFLANHYHLPDAPKNLFRPLFRYIYANYLMWNLGYPQQGFLQPLFFAAKALKLYYTLLFYKAVIGGVIEMVNDYLEKKQCLNGGKQWLWENTVQEYICSVCGDLPIYYRDIFTVEDCFRSYLLNLRTLEEIGNFTNRFDLRNVTTLDLMYQKFGCLEFGSRSLSKFLALLKNKLPSLEKFYGIDPSCGYIISRDIEAISDFIQDTAIKDIKFLGITIPPGVEQLQFKALMKTIADLNITKLEIRGLNLQDSDDLYFKKIFKFFENSTLSSLSLKYIQSKPRMAIDILPHKLRELSITYSQSVFGDKECIDLAAKLPHSQIKYLNLAENSLSFVCVAALADSLSKVSTEITIILSEPLQRESGATLYFFSGGDFSDSGIKVFAKILAKKPAVLLKSLSIGVGDLTQETFIEFIEALPGSKLEELNLYLGPFYDHLIPIRPLINYTIVMPKLIDSLSRSRIKKFGFWGDGTMDDSNIKILTEALPKRLNRLISLDLCNNGIGDEGIEAIAKVLGQTKIQILKLMKNNINHGISLLGHYLNQTELRELDISYNLINSENIEIFSRALKGSKVKTLYLNSQLVDRQYRYWEKSQNISTHVIKNLQGSVVEKLDLSCFNIPEGTGKILADYLINSPPHGLWIQNLEKDKISAYSDDATSLTHLYLRPYHTWYGQSLADIDDNDLSEFCAVLSKTTISISDFRDNIQGNYFEPTGDCFTLSPSLNYTIFRNCGIISASSVLRPMGPYILLYRLYQATQQSLYTVLYKRYKAFMADSVQSEYTDCNNITAEPISSADFSEKTLSIIDISHYSGGETIVVDLKAHGAVAARGSINSNNLFIGSEETLLDVSQTRRTNFLQSCKNNKLRLGFFSQDHVVIQEGQGMIKIHGFNSKDTSHLVVETTVYCEANITICQNEVIENDIPAAVIHLKETTIQLINTHCEDIENAIKINDPESIDEAQREVLNSPENHQSVLYTSLLSICETFLGAVHKSALFTAVPVFAAEILYRSGGYTRAETERFSEEIQKLLALSFADSPHVVAASFLASWLATKLTHSPHMISTISIGAGIVASVASTALSADVPLSWMALQTGVALMGSVVGGYSVRWGFNKANDAKVYLSSKMGFWSNNTEETKEEKLIQQNILSNIDHNTPIHFTI